MAGGISFSMDEVRRALVDKKSRSIPTLSMWGLPGNGRVIPKKKSRGRNGIKTTRTDVMAQSQIRKR